MLLFLFVGQDNMTKQKRTKLVDVFLNIFRTPDHIRTSPHLKLRLIAEFFTAAASRRPCHLRGRRLFYLLHRSQNLLPFSKHRPGTAPGMLRLCLVL